MNESMDERKQSAEDRSPSRELEEWGCCTDRRKKEWLLREECS